MTPHILPGVIASGFINITGGWTPASIFASGEGGSVLDISVIGSLFQDVAGTIPVTSDLDPVALVVDQSGNGMNATQSDNAKRPIYRRNGGKPYLQMSGAQWLEYPVGAMNFANLSAHILAQNYVSRTVIFSAPQALGSHPSPYYRWCLYHNYGTEFYNRINGAVITYNVADIKTTPKHLGLDTVAGSFYTNNVSVGTFTPQAITYPNSVPVRIGANGAGGEVATMDFYGSLIVNRGLTAPERSATSAWLLGLA